MRLELLISRVFPKRELTGSTPLINVAAPPRLTVSQQWARLTGVLQSAISSAGEAKRRQTAAHQQLDLAQYALYTLGDELSGVMTIPGRREPASVHVLEAPAALTKSKALAA